MACVFGRLCLVGINAAAFRDEPVLLARLFPGYGDRVFARWYSGTLRVPQGRQLKYVHMGYASTYERGVLRGTWVRHNAQGAGDSALQGRGSTS